MERLVQTEAVFPPNNPPNNANATELPPEIINKIVQIIGKGNDATIKRKKGGYTVYETKLVER